MQTLETRDKADSRIAAFRKSARELLTFSLGTESYGIDILAVQEIRGYGNVTKIANAPAFLKGVINLRGVIVPILDLRIKFRLSEPTYHELTVVIILNVAERTVGLVVDAVSDVVTLALEDIKSAPEIAGGFDTDYLMGLGVIGERMLVLIDIDRLLSSAEIGLIEAVAA